MPNAQERKKNDVKAFWTLVSMQWKETLVFPIKGNLKDVLTRVLLYVLGIGALTGLFFLMFYLLGYIGIFGLGGKIPLLLWNLFFYAVLLIHFLSSLPRISNAMYFSPDNPVLLSFPVPSQYVFFSKILVILLRDLLRSAFSMLPLFIAIGIVYLAPAYYYFWLILCWVIFVTLSTALAGILSIPYYYVSSFLRKHPYVKTGILLGLLGLGTWFLFFLVSLMPEDLSLVAKWANVYYPGLLDFAQNIEKALTPLTFLSRLLTGYDPAHALDYPSFNPVSIASLWIALSLLGILAVFVLLGYFFLRKFFFQMASKPSEYSKKATKASSSKPLPSFLSVLRKDLLNSLRTSETLASAYLLVMGAPLAILFLNVIFQAMKKTYAGQMYTIVVNALIIALILLATNVSMASVFSKEAHNATTLFSDPVSLRRSILAKLLMRGVLMLISIIVTVVVYANYSTFAFMRLDVFFWCVFFLFFGHFLWSAELDYINPRHHVYAQSSRHIGFNPNEVKSSALAFLLSFAFAGLLFLFLNESALTGIYHLLVATALFFVARVFLFIQKVRAYGALPFEGRGSK
ncbi:MAG: hypothetical protein K6E59_04355 [Bacilli bacterium]|nr:hypothetical protein [Bacilli bacterium]